MEFINVLLADDEDIVLEDLKNLIPWSENGFKIIATATNGTRAFELFEKYEPQIVITDIKMPGMDGIELCKRILAKNPNAKILLLTAYKDFNYAKDAISLGVSNYLLKHEINSKNLLLELDRIQKEIIKEQMQLHLMRNRFFKRILEDDVVEDSIFAYKDHNRRAENYVLLIVKMDVPFDVIDNIACDNKNKLVNLLNIKKEDLPEFVNYFEIIEMQNGYVVIVLSIYKIVSQQKLIERLQYFTAFVQKELFDMYQVTVSISITNTALKQEALKTLYDFSVEHLKYGVFYGRGKIFTHTLQKLINSQIHPFVKEKIDIFIDSLAKSDSDTACRCIDEIFEAIANSHWDTVFLKQVCNMLLKHLGELSTSNGISNVEELCKADKDCCAFWYCIKDISKWFKDITRQLVKEMENSNNSGLSNKIRRVIRYIDLHYNEDLTLEKVSEKLGFSREYLSQVFKKETGQTFLEYLTKYRVEIAKKLLLEGEYKIYEIAEMIGYSTSQYFSEVFRKVTGVNPMDFRNGVGNAKEQH